MDSTLKRGRETDTLDEGQDHLPAPPAKVAKLSSDNATAADDATEPKPQKAPVKSTTKKASAKPTTTTKKSAPTKSDSSGAGEGMKIMKHIKSDYANLLKDYVYNPNGYYGVTADNFSSRMALYIPAIAKLSETRPKDAFEVMMYASEHCYGDLDFCYKSSGFGETEEPFKKMDGSMVKIIEKRVAEEGKGELGVVGDVYESDGEGWLSAFREELGGKKSLNKSERGKQDKYRRIDFSNSVAKRRKLREGARDWIGNALTDLVRTRDLIEQHGIGEFYFAQSIAKLEELKAGGA